MGKYKAARDIGKYIGATMRRWKKGEVIDLDGPTVEQNFETEDYEPVSPQKENRKQRGSRIPESVEG